MIDYPDKYWHCRLKKANAKEVTLTDLSFDELEHQIVLPYMSGQRFNIKGQIFTASNIDEIQIVHTPHDEEYNSNRYHQDNRNASDPTFVILGVYLGPFNIEDATDYTQNLLFSEGSPVTNNSLNSELDGSSKDIFIVHGHDDALRHEVCRLLEQLGLNPIVLHEQADKGRTIIEKFEDHANVGFAIVLLTPDDEGKLRDEAETTPRARQNVIFELGFFYGKLGRNRVCALLKEGLEFPSDMDGVLYKRADSDGAWKYKVATEMKEAGLGIDLNRIR